MPRPQGGCRRNRGAPSTQFQRGCCAISALLGPRWGHPHGLAVDVSDGGGVPLIDASKAKQSVIEVVVVSGDLSFSCPQFEVVCLRVEMGDLVETDFAVAEVAEPRPYLVLINAKSVPQTVRQTAVRYGEYYGAHKPACKVGSESAGVVDGKPDNYPGRDCREREPYWCIERCVGKNTRLGWVRAHGSQSALLPGVWTLYQGNRWVLHVRGKVAGFDTHGTAFIFCVVVLRCITAVGAYA